MNITKTVCYVVITVLWNLNYAYSVFLTSTLITGMMGGYLIGRMPLGTFLGALTNNASLPTLPPVSSLLPSFPSFSSSSVQQEEPKKVVEVITPAPLPVVSSTTFSYPQYNPYYAYNYPTLPPTAPPVPAIPNYNFAFPNTQYPGNGIYPYNLLTTTTTPSPPTPEIDFSLISPVEVPVSLDHKIRERFIRQLALIDPLNCLPKTFCEVTSDPYGAVLALDKGSIVGMSNMHLPTITKEELIAYESRLPQSAPSPPSQLPPTTTRATTTRKPSSQKDEEEDDDKSHSGSDEAEDDVDSGSHSEEGSNEEDDSFERYRKEHEHKLEMQALDEMIDEIEDPETYMYILRDKQKRKDARRKYRKKHNGNSNQGFSEREDTEAFRHASLVDQDNTSGHGFQENEEPSMYLTRRAGSDDDYHFMPPYMPPPPLPPRPQPPFYRRATTEPPIEDMFADDPFFDDVPGRRARSMKVEKTKTGKSKGRAKRELGDPITQYKLAYIVAEKYKNPNLCKAAFPSCPYQTKTIMSVVNRLESGLLPFGKSQINRYRDKSNRNNLEQFRNTLVAIERLNKATMDARARGEPIDIDEMTKVVSSPTSEIDANTSQDIVNEFQRVVAKIQTAQFTKRRLQLEKAKPKNSDRPRTNFDAVHYYKKAQMDDLKPKARLKTGILETKTNVRQQDDEAAHVRNVPTFKQTYREMFKKGVKKVNRTNSVNSGRLQQTINRKAQKKSNSGKVERNNHNHKPPETWVEDDERDAKNEELAVDALITQGRRQRSRIT